jgi:hypothetical protein
MVHMVFIRQIDPRSFLHFSVKESSFCLRAYPSASAPPREVRRQGDGCFAENIFELAAQPGNMILDAPAVPFSNSRFWHGHTQQLNNEHLQANQQPPPQKSEVVQPVRSVGGDLEETEIDIEAGGELIGVLRVSGSAITWRPRGQQAGYRLSWAKFGALMQLHGAEVGE